MLNKAVKVRLYPNREQRIYLAKSFGCARWVWNYCLAQMNQVYKDTGKGISAYTMKKQLPKLKKQYEWLKEPHSQVLQQSVLNLSRAFINFFDKKAGQPAFKSKQKKQSIQYPQNVKVGVSYIEVPKLGLIKAKVHRRFDGAVKTVTISKSRSGKYYASILYELDETAPIANAEGQAIGIDLGLNHFAITSDGSKFENPKHLAKHERNLKRKQQKLARKQKGSKKRIKARQLVARVHEKIANTRTDFLHKLSRQLVNENQVIVCENLNVKGMVKNHNLAKAISDVGWGRFTTMLEYKCNCEGKVYLEVDRFFASSKTCSNCYYKLSDLPLEIRSWSCPSCRTDHDRDINAAINIRDEGLRLFACGRRAAAQGGKVRPANRRKSVNQAFADELGSRSCTA